MKIEEVRDSWIKIKKDKDSEGMFDYCDFTKEFMNCVELNISKVLDFESDFYMSVINELDIWTNRVLETVRNRINNEIKEYYRCALYELEKGIRNVKIMQKSKNELLRKLEITKAKYYEDISNFEDIFYMKNEQYPEFTIKDVIEFCFEVEKDISPNFSLATLYIENKCENVYKGNIFPYMVDVMSNLIRNAVEHSQFQDLSLLQIDVSVHSIDERIVEWNFDENIKKYSIILNIRNNLEISIDENELKGKVKNIIENMEANTFKEKSKLGKGSGLYKIARTIYYNLDDIGFFYFDVKNGWFDFNIAMNLKKYLVEA